MTNKFMTDPVRILVKRDELTLEVSLSSAIFMVNFVYHVKRKLQHFRFSLFQGIKQYFVDVGEEEWKFDTLCDLYGRLIINQAIIFCNTRKKVNTITKQNKTNLVFLKLSGFIIFVDDL